MRTYWDLSEAERAELTADDVQKYLDAELMLKGVLKVKPLVVEPVPDEPAPTSTAFIVRCGPTRYGETLSVAFPTVEAARAFVALGALSVSSEYMGNTSVRYTDTISEAEIAEARIFTKEEKDACKLELKRAGEAKTENERREREYQEATKAQTDALKGLWEDWHECRATHAKLRQVADTFEDYKRTAGDATLAAKFLAKVFTQDLIAEASKRFRFPIEAIDGVGA